MGFAASTIALLALAQGVAGEPERLATLDRACGLVQEIYPMLMLAAIMEAPTNCGDSHMGEFVDCDADDSPEQRARQAKRLEIRERQEAAFKAASLACEAWGADRGSPSLQQEVVRTFREARQAGTSLPKEVED